MGPIDFWTPMKAILVLAVFFLVAMVGCLICWGVGYSFSWQSLLGVAGAAVFLSSIANRWLEE